MEAGNNPLRAILDQLLAGARVTLQFPDIESERRFYTSIHSLKSKTLQQAGQVGLEFNATTLCSTGEHLIRTYWLEKKQPAMFTVLKVEHAKVSNGN